ncbi:hypothetical protein CORC01_11887 [Colletotrichum orchidophilum]|uniref:Fungal specific transcription factor n=1 Tax=Colletotrichum orchidophilum TaxID=1209926 RepID=A0A1G4AUF7_9PEZI|nr:uncharacterized protein CORC01_11887 [Colletotrichum orchidophilum]OHE92809.1 hypothetical protein CORC01_11887 [Colletotrichum orchidophilum]
MDAISKPKKGLGSSIWATRGKSQYYTPSQPSYKSQPKQSVSSVITPATPRPPSPTKNGAGVRPAANTPMNAHTPGPTSAPGLTPNGNGNATSRTGPSAQQEFKRYIQIVRRLKWKLPYLSHGYHHAIARPGSPLYGGETDAEEAELMFKLDFYEYYMLLERALVHLMGVFGITISRDGWVTARQTYGNGNGATGASQQQATHTYHQNVIAALEKEDNPLHEALGSGEVLFHLSRAKELRNRWKYAEEGDGKAGRSSVAGRERAGTAPLESYDLDRIFRYIFAGFDAGYAVAERWVQAEMEAGAGGDGDRGGEGIVEMEEDEFDFMVEAMDWEAV